jgi:hypothetical protein
MAGGALPGCVVERVRTPASQCQWHSLATPGQGRAEWCLVLLRSTVERFWVVSASTSWRLLLQAATSSPAGSMAAHAVHPVFRSRASWAVRWYVWCFQESASKRCHARVLSWPVGCLLGVWGCGGLGGGGSAQWGRRGGACQLGGWRVCLLCKRHSAVHGAVRRALIDAGSAPHAQRFLGT